MQFGLTSLLYFQTEKHNTAIFSISIKRMCDNQSFMSLNTTRNKVENPLKRMRDNQSFMSLNTTLLSLYLHRILFDLTCFLMDCRGLF